MIAVLRPLLRDFVLVGGVAFVIRAAFVVVQTRFAIFDVSFVATDSTLYLRLADAVRGGAGFSIDGQPTAFVGPIYPLFLAVLRAAGFDVFAVGIVQSLLGALTACLVAATVALLPNVAHSGWPRRWLSLGAGICCALYPHFIFWTGYVLTETLFVFLVAGSLFLLAAGTMTKRPALVFVSGLLAAAAALTRSPYLAVAVVLACWLAYASRRKAVRPILPAVFLVAFVAPLLVWAMRNAIELGSPVVTTTASGWVLYQANSAGSTGGSSGYLGVGDFVPVDAPAELDEAHRDAFYLSRTLGDIRADPGAFVARTVPKVWNMWRPAYEGSSFRNGLLTIATYLPLLVFGLIGLVALARTAPIPFGAMPLIAFVVWFLLHAVVGGMIRYRLPAELLLTIAAPIGAAVVVGALRPDPRARQRQA